MFLVDKVVLVGALLLVIGIVSSKFSARFGLPGLVVFIGVGMLAGSEGIGGIGFEDYTAAHAVGTVALAVILFDGGLRTSWSSFRLAAAPALVMATVGVVLTTLVTGAAAALLAGIPLLHALLLGSIVGSTDAAAVFSILRSQGVRLRERLAATLEVESGSNDPMAIFLTVGLILYLTGRMDSGLDLGLFFLLQFGVGIAVGVLAGLGTARLVNAINVEAAGLYPLLTAAGGMLAYGAAAVLGGSGFLAVYLAGIVIGNSNQVFQRGTLHFVDAAAWMSQIAMFVVLGLLSTPSALLENFWVGLAIAFVLIFVARPVAVGLTLLPFRFPPRELALLSWGGLKGAVPIILATYPLLLGLRGGETIFNLVFFVVLVSAISQGWSLPFVAERLGLVLPTSARPPVSLEITSLKHVDGDIVEYTITPDSRAADRQIRELALPDGVVVAMISRGSEIIPPRGSTVLRPDDHVFIVLRPVTRRLVDHVLAPGSPEIPILVEFPLRGNATVAELSEFYGIELDGAASLTLDQLMKKRLGTERVRQGQSVRIGEIVLYAREVSDLGVELVGLALSGSGPADSG